MTENNPNIEEQWKPVVGLEDTYEVSSQGRIRNIGIRQTGYTGKVLKQKIDKYGYPAITLRRLGVNYYRTVHTVVMAAFVGPCPDEFQTNHKDGNKLNNCLSNLEYVTTGQNVRHAVRLGLHPQGNSHWTRKGKIDQPPRKTIPRPWRRKFNEETVAKIRLEYSSDEITQPQLAARYQASTDTIRRILKHLY